MSEAKIATLEQKLAQMEKTIEATARRMDSVVDSQLRALEINGAKVQLSLEQITSDIHGVRKKLDNGISSTLSELNKTLEAQVNEQRALKRRMDQIEAEKRISVQGRWGFWAAVAAAVATGLMTFINTVYRGGVD